MKKPLVLWNKMITFDVGFQGRRDSTVMTAVNKA